VSRALRPSLPLSPLSGDLHATGEKLDGGGISYSFSFSVRGGGYEGRRESDIEALVVL